MRTRDGRKVARAKGVFGKHPKLTKNQARHLVELNHSGGYSSAELFSVARSPAWRKRCSWCRQRDCLATLLGSDAAGSVPWFPHGAAAICWETGRVAARDVVIDRYLDYLDACNRRAWDELGRFLADTVLVNGRAETRLEYVENVKATTVAFPDYRWELLRAVVEADWLAVHLHDVGTRARPFSALRATDLASKLTSSTCIVSSRA